MFQTALFYILSYIMRHATLPVSFRPTIRPVDSQLFHVVESKESSVHQLGDAVSLHLQGAEGLHPLEGQAVHHLDLVAFNLTGKWK